MKFTTSIVAVCGLFLAANAIPTTVESAPKPGYDIFVPSWEVELHPGGPKVIVNGTVEQVRHEMIKRNPEWEKHYPAHDVDALDLTKRTNFDGAKFDCGRPRPLATTSRLKEGVSYLRGLKGSPRNGAGPRACGRVSCSWNSAIWWCNEDNKPKTLNSWGSIADGANYLIDRCSEFGVLSSCSGRIDHPTRWAVEVVASRC